MERRRARSTGAAAGLACRGRQIPAVANAGRGDPGRPRGCEFIGDGRGAALRGTAQPQGGHAQARPVGPGFGGARQRAGPAKREHRLAASAIVRKVAELRHPRRGHRHALGGCGQWRRLAANSGGGAERPEPNRDRPNLGGHGAWSAIRSLLEPDRGDDGRCSEVRRATSCRAAMRVRTGRGSAPPAGSRPAR